MGLETQIQSIIVSFVYGMFVSFAYNILYFLLYNKNVYIKIISCFLFNILLTILFFYIMYLINYANIHPYFIMLVVVGFLLGNIKTKSIRIFNKNKERT